MRRSITAIALVTAAMALSACSSSGVEAFDRAQTEADIADVDYEEWQLERDSIRFLAEEEGSQFFVARGDGDTLCIVWVSPGMTGSSCGDGGLATQGSVGPKVELVVPDMGERPGWRKLAPSLYAEN